eukprot:772764-Pyramimonas_sp.AAC.1
MGRRLEELVANRPPIRLPLLDVGERHVEPRQPALLALAQGGVQGDQAVPDQASDRESVEDADVRFAGRCEARVQVLDKRWPPEVLTAAGMRLTEGGGGGGGGGVDYGNSEEGEED